MKFSNCRVSAVGHEECMQSAHTATRPIPLSLPNVASSLLQRFSTSLVHYNVIFAISVLHLWALCKILGALHEDVPQSRAPSPVPTIADF